MKKVIITTAATLFLMFGYAQDKHTTETHKPDAQHQHIKHHNKKKHTGQQPATHQKNHRGKHHQQRRHNTTMHFIPVYRRVTEVCLLLPTGKTQGNN